jgi:hypothetical protein
MVSCEISLVYWNATTWMYRIRKILQGIFVAELILHQCLYIIVVAIFRHLGEFGSKCLSCLSLGDLVVFQVINGVSELIDRQQGPWLLGLSQS